jgi:hypothetical protein
MHKSATKCNETVGKWCKNKHGASKIIDTLETYHWGGHTTPGAARPGLRPQVVWCPPGPSPSRTLAPWVFWLNRIFAVFSGIFPESWISTQKQDTRAILLKTALVRVSCIQNTKIRGETTAKVFGKSRYALDVSAATVSSSSRLPSPRNPRALRHCIPIKKVAHRPKMAKKGMTKQALNWVPSSFDEVDLKNAKKEGF